MMMVRKPSLLFSDAVLITKTLFFISSQFVLMCAKSSRRSVRCLFIAVDLFIALEFLNKLGSSVLLLLLILSVFTT